MSKSYRTATRHQLETWRERSETRRTFATVERSIRDQWRETQRAMLAESRRTSKRTERTSKGSK